MGDQMGEHFGVGLGSEFCALGCQRFLQREEVLDDPVVDYDDLTTGIGVRMSVAVAGHPMRGPPGVPDAECAGERMLVEYSGESGEFPLGLGDRQIGAVVDGDSGGVVPAVLEPPQSVDDDRSGVLPPDVTHDSAHAVVSLRRETGEPAGQARLTSLRSLFRGHPRVLIRIVTAVSGREGIRRIFR